VVRKGELSEQEVMDYVAARVAPFKKVRLVEFIEQIPKSPTGKILRRELLARERRRVGAA
jgi:acyl-coenzyme A synthetase/AMP-(fatty) acid ligase